VQLIRRFCGAVKNLLGRDQADRELDEEVHSYLEELVSEKVKAGMSLDQARRAARIEMGGVEQVKDSARGGRSGAWLETLGQDVCYSARMLRNNPGFAAAAILTLALGIGANTAIFTVLNAVVLRPLPYANPDRLVVIWSEFKDAGQGRAPASGPELIYLRERSRLLDDVAGIWASTGALTGIGEPEQLKVGFVTSNFFSLLGVKPQLGRTFLPHEQGRGSQPVIVLSDGLWQRRFGADPHIVGSAVNFEGTASTVIGVMPKDFEVIFPSDAGVPPDIQAWTPFPYDLAQSPRDLGSCARLAGCIRA
jgi:hypothetical protein